MIELEWSSIKTELPFSYRSRIPAVPRLLAIFLHGFTDHGGSLLRRLFGEDETGLNDLFAHHTAVLAPNGPFPVPVKTERGWKEAYSWYFYDDRAGKMIISPDTARLAVSGLVRDLNLSHLPKVIVGFSQGGYLAPLLAHTLHHVREIIGLGTGYRPDFYASIAESTRPLITGIHGTNDDIFPVDQARRAHSEILKTGFQGDFTALSGLGHSTTREVGQLVLDRLKA